MLQAAGGRSRVGLAALPGREPRRQARWPRWQALGCLLAVGAADTGTRRERFGAGRLKAAVEELSAMGLIGGRRVVEITPDEIIVGQRTARQAFRR
jgi:hypothetical protein